MTRAALRQLLVAALVPLAGASVSAAPTTEQGDLHGIKLGLAVAELPVDGFVDFACGSDGGPPKRVLNEWSDFKQCLSEPTGLREVQARFDDEQAYQARAIEDAAEIERAGTKIAGHPVIFSVLFSDAGTAETIRIVTDPRAPTDLRRRAYLLRIRVLGQYGVDGWDCTDLGLAERETAVGGIAIKQRCEKSVDDRRHMLFTQFYRRPGQTGFMDDGITPRPGDFVSSTRWEISRLGK